MYKRQILLTIIITIFSIILLDTIQAVAFKNSPIISWRVKDVNDSDSYVDKGFLIDTYYCVKEQDIVCLLYTSPSPRDGLLSRMPSSA